MNNRTPIFVLAVINADGILLGLDFETGGSAIARTCGDAPDLRPFCEATEFSGLDSVERAIEFAVPRLPRGTVVHPVVIRWED